MASCFLWLRLLPRSGLMILARPLKAGSARPPPQPQSRQRRLNHAVADATPIAYIRGLPAFKGRAQLKCRYAAKERDLLKSASSRESAIKRIFEPYY